MKHLSSLIIVIIAIHISQNIAAQSIDKGIVNVRIGGNATLGATFTNVSSNGINADEDTSAVLATQIPVLAEFGILKFLSLNIGFQAGSWLNEDPEDNSVVVLEKRISQFNLGAKLYPVNKDNFNLYVGFQLGLGGFRTEKENTGFIIFNEKQKWTGTNSNISIGMNWYYGGKFGSYFQFGYSGYNFELKEFTSNNNNLLGSPLNIKADMAVKGVHVELGLCYKFGG